MKNLLVEFLTSHIDKLEDESEKESIDRLLYRFRMFTLDYYQVDIYAVNRSIQLLYFDSFIYLAEFNLRLTNNDILLLLKKYDIAFNDDNLYETYIIY